MKYPVALWLPVELSSHSIGGWKILPEVIGLHPASLRKMVKLDMEMTVSVFKNKAKKIQGEE